MALNTYGKINYEVMVPISIEYQKSVVHPSGGTYGSTAQYQYDRHVQKVYKFKGMDSATATRCLKDKKAQYNRKFMGWKMIGNSWHPPSYFSKWGMVSSSPLPYHAQVAQFNVNRTSDAPVFDVQITIDEIVTMYASYDYDISTEYGRQQLENKFQQSSPETRVSFVYEYDYDENLT